MAASELADPAQVAAVVAAARRAHHDGPGPVVVALDGRSGAGKSVLASAVAAELGCPIARIDDVFPGWDGLAAGVALFTEHVLEPLSHGEEGLLPTWDWAADRAGARRPVPVTDVLVVEGCGVLVAPASRYADVAVWVEASDDVRRRRALARDGETYAPHWERWAAQERALYAADPPMARADLVLRTADAA